MPGAFAPFFTPIPVNLFVSSTGNDSTGTGTVGNPWATLDKARAFVRSGVMVADTTIHTDAAYKQTTALVFTDADSGRNGFNIVYKNDGAVGTAKLLGGVPLTGWSVFAGSVYRAALAGPLIGTMWENGVRAVSARTPAFVPDATYPMARAPYLLSAGVDQSLRVLQYTPGDLTPGSWDLNSASILLWPEFLARESDWFTDNLPITSVNAGAKQITVGVDAFGPFFNSIPGARYFAQGDLSMLTGAGQFYHDVTNGFLYYWPRSTPIASQDIVVPTLDKVVSFAGSAPGTPVHNIVLDGFEVSYSNFPRSWQAGAPNYFAGIYLTNSEHIQILNANVHNTGGHGIYGHSYCKTTRVDKSWIHNTGSYGIFFENRPTWSPDLGDVNTLNVCTNFRVDHVGELDGGASTVYLRNVSNSLIEYADLHDAPRWGIGLVGAYFDDPAKNYGRGNTIQYAKIAKCGQDSGDLGAIHIFGVGDNITPGINSLIQITIAQSAANASMLDIAPCDLFTDNASPQQVLTNIWAQSASQFRTNGSGGGTTTNVSWLGGFNSGLIDVANIGVKASFPY